MKKCMIAFTMLIMSSNFAMQESLINATQQKKNQEVAAMRCVCIFAKQKEQKESLRRDSLTHAPNQKFPA